MKEQIKGVKHVQPSIRQAIQRKKSKQSNLYTDF